PAVVTSAGLILALLAVKLAAKSIGVWPLARVFKLPTREANYTTLMMATGLTFGTISALFGLEHNLIDGTQYTVLVTVVIGSAVPRRSSSRRSRTRRCSRSPAPA